MERLSVNLDNLKPGSRVIKVNQPLRSSAFKQIKKDLLELSWEEGTIYFYEKIQ